VAHVDGDVTEVLPSHDRASNWPWQVPHHTLAEGTDAPGCSRGLVGVAPGARPLDTHQGIPELCDLPFVFLARDLTSDVIEDEFALPRASGNGSRVVVTLGSEVGGDPPMFAHIDSVDGNG
jgi:hypothetical protein